MDGIDYAHKENFKWISVIRLPDFVTKRLHHEIYLSDARRIAPEKLRTMIRHPVRKAEGEGTAEIQPLAQ